MKAQNGSRDWGCRIRRENGEKQGDVKTSYDSGGGWRFKTSPAFPRAVVSALKMKW